MWLIQLSFVQYFFLEHFYTLFTLKVSPHPITLLVPTDAVIICLKLLMMETARCASVSLLPIYGMHPRVCACVS
jgi:hypothetical protein